MTRARVLSIVPYKILPAKLGGEKGIALFNEYVSKYVELLAVSTKNNETELASGYRMLPLLSVSRSRYINVFLYFRIRRLLAQHHATHLLIEHPYYGWLAWLVKKTTRVGWVVHSHNIEFERSRSIGRKWWPLLKWYERWVYRASDINFFISEDDKTYAIEKLGIDPAKSHAITYGVEIPGVPSDRADCRRIIEQKYKVAPDEKILLFNGALYHHTNYEALQVILDQVNPFLLQQGGLKYKIIVCGKGLPAFFEELKAYRDKNIIYAGFVDDISIYFKATDHFLNPIISGGGVKTKAIEAIAYNCSVVSTEIGALGLVREACGKKLEVVANGNWVHFCEKLLSQMQEQENTSADFYEYYYWGNIAKKVARVLDDSIRH